MLERTRPTVVGSASSSPALNGSATVRVKGRSLSNRFAGALRWLHIYISLLGFAALMFFAVTGVTLNHPQWFGASQEKVTTFSGKMPLEWLNRPGNSSPVKDAAPVDESASGEEPLPDYDSQIARLEVVEHLRSTHAIRGAVKEFRTDDYECLVLFRGPSYAAEAYVTRATGKYNLTVTQLGTVALINDLHKGRDTGFGWSIVIDISAIVTVIVSVTGLVLIFTIRRKRWSGLLTTVAGTILLVVAYAVCVP